MTANCGSHMKCSISINMRYRGFQLSENLKTSLSLPRKPSINANRQARKPGVDQAKYFCGGRLRVTGQVCLAVRRSRQIWVQPTISIADVLGEMVGKFHLFEISGDLKAALNSPVAISQRVLFTSVRGREASALLLVMGNSHSALGPRARGVSNRHDIMTVEFSPRSARARRQLMSDFPTIRDTSSILAREASASS